MANRSYLYSSNITPEENSGEKKLTGISEWNYDIPIVFKLLLSGDPNVCKSSIWDVEQKIAIVGDYEKGLKNLNNFLGLIKRSDAHDLIEEARTFLCESSNKKKYFILECGEIFDMNDEDLATQNLQLLNELLNLEDNVEQSLTSIAVSDHKGKGFFQGLFSQRGKNPKNDSLDPVYALGLGNWSNVLYFDFSHE